MIYDPKYNSQILSERPHWVSWLVLQFNAAT